MTEIKRVVAAISDYIRFGSRTIGVRLPHTSNYHNIRGQPIYKVDRLLSGQDLHDGSAGCRLLADFVEEVSGLDRLVVIPSS
jgi:hypothetical protein